MKKTILFLCMLAVAGIAKAQTMNVYAIHFEGTQFETYEGTLDANESVEDFLEAQGIDVQELSVMQFDQAGEADIWVIPRSDNQDFKISNEVNGVKTFVTGSGDDGTVMIKKCEKTATTEDVRVIQIEQEGENTEIDIEQILQENGIEIPEGENVMIKTMIIEDSNVIELDGLEGQENIEQDIQIFKTVGPEGEEETQIWINGEEATEEELENMNMFEFDINVDGPAGENNEWMDAFNQTIVILTPETPEVKSMSSKKEGIQELRFSPNPNDGKFSVSFEVEKKKDTFVQVTDLQGKVIEERQLGKIKGLQNLDFDISAQGAGTYLFTVYQGNEKLVERILVQ